MTASSTVASEQLQKVCDRYWDLQLERHPVWASELGYHRFDHLLPDYGSASRELYYQQIHAVEADFKGVELDALQGNDRVTHEVMAHLLRTDLDGEVFREECWSVNPLHGPWTMLTELADRQPVVPHAALERLKARFRAAPRLLEQITENLRDGIQQGQVVSQIGPERVAAQLRRLLKIDPDKSSFMPGPERVAALTDEATARVKQELVEVVQGEVYPALDRFASFLEQEYLPHTRTEPGLCHMPSGREYYQFLIELFTSRPDSAERIHQVGLEELKRVHEEMRHISLEMAGIADLREFAAWLRARPDQYLHDRDAVVAFNRAAIARAEAALPRAFNRLPTRRCVVRPIEQFREMDSPSGYYSHASEDGTRPAYYYVNTSRPESRPAYNMEALAFHEAVPGHHLQIALAQELDGLHPVRRHIGQTAYVEGWALYSERLCNELGLYSSPTMRFGMLNYQAWRAARLVVDTGLHALGWSREKAMEVLMANTAHGTAEASIEVDRYICMPGQALSYMTGRMAIDALRRECEQRLGSQFDLKIFHARTLEHGALPLASLERVVQHWLAEEGV
ncbi:MAG: DUF885 domain-containing protein [Myxococcota bacterium]